MDRTIANLHELDRTVLESLFLDRGAQFVRRLGWDLCVTPNGAEIDEYDSEGTTYLVVHKDGRHIGSCRMRPVSAGTMIVDHFREVFPGAVMFLCGQEHRVYELTRFCRSPKASKEEAREMLEIMAEMIDSFRDENGLTGFVAVVYPEIARFLSSIGVRFLRLACSQADGREIHMICIVHCVRVDRLVARSRLSEKSQLGRILAMNQEEDLGTSCAA